MNIAKFLIRAGAVMADHPAAVVGTRRVCTYGQLSARVAALAGALLDRLGLKPGDRVALAMKNCPEYLEALYACWHAGLVAVPVNAKLHAREFAYIIDDSGAGLVLVSPDLAATIGEAMQAAASAPPVVEIGSAAWRALASAAPIGLHPASPLDPAWLFYTSGTTGRPKGAILSHRNLLAMTSAYFMDVDAIAPGDSILHAAPMSHGSGLYILPHVAAMATHVIPESGGFEPAETFQLIAAHPGISFFAAPTMVHRLVGAPQAAGADTRNLKTIIYGGGPMYVEDCKKALALFGPKLAQIYGQGESPMTITALSKRLHADTGHPRFEERLGSVGYAQSVVEVRIAGANDEPLAAGEVGEILVRGETVMAGYWNKPEATRETLRGGWLHTGDMGTLDADGFLTLKDRSKDVIISGGTNIYPREVEEVLLLHPAVKEVSVVGRSHPDWGEEVVAFVVAMPGQGLSSDDLDRLCTDNIARFKRPKEYRFVEALPKNNYGKVLKTELREWATRP
ncbi:MAG: AMP-binding protein [Rhodocyclaceae bacterium]|jgi:long-chain acyl-CoA synthetase|nr:AMP-binding protein [Rhodocyclaceae bacterium]